VDLSSSQLQRLQQDGYLSVGVLAPPSEIPVLRRSIERLFEEKAGLREGAYGELIASDDGHDHEPNSPQIRMVADYAPELHKSECFHSALRLARQILGPHAVFMSDIAILKEPRRGAPTPWHQDEAFRDPHFTYREVTIWVALQDVDQNSGCLMFIGGSHRDSLHLHRVPGDGADSLALECVEGVNESSAVPCPLPAGGCTIHFPRTLHRSTPNSSAVKRIGYSMTFGLPPEVSPGPMELPWLRDRIPNLQSQRRRWMRHGGWAVTAWRRLRRGEIRGWQTLRYWAIRGIRTIRRGG
jgi:Phytanoyl-CoA dioxygenase (PhyH)